MNNIINKFKELNGVNAYFGNTPDGVVNPYMLFFIPKVAIKRGTNSRKIFSYDLKIKVEENELVTSYEKGIDILEKIDIKTFPVKVTSIGISEEESQIIINLSFVEERFEEQQEGTKIGKISFDTKIK